MEQNYQKFRMQSVIYLEGMAVNPQWKWQSSWICGEKQAVHRWWKQMPHPYTRGQQSIKNT